MDRVLACGKQVPLLTFGVLTDVQYADRDDCASWYSAEKVRYYRSSLDHIRKAFRTWEREAHPVNFAIQLGDLFDGCNRALDLGPHSAACTALGVFDEFPAIATYHVLGNHELDNFTRSQLASYFRQLQQQDVTSSQRSSTGGTGAHPANGSPISDNNCGSQQMRRLLGYYSFCPIEGVLVVVLDCFDVCLPNYDRGNAAYDDVKTFLKQFHNSEDVVMWDYDDHLEGVDKRFVAYNGGLGPEQIKWLDDELQAAEAAGQKVIVCGHVAVLPESSALSCVVWNYSDVLEVMHRYRCVIAYLAGHLHDTGYAMDDHGIHHVTFAGIIEVKPDSMSFSTIHVFSDHLKIVGYGREKSYTLKFGTPMTVVESAVDNVSTQVSVRA